MNHKLTKREKQILILVAQGLTNKAISTELSLSTSTVENHLHKIYSKINVINRSQATAYVIFAGIVSIPQK